MNITGRYLWCFWTAIFLSCPSHCSGLSGADWLFEEGKDYDEGALDLSPAASYGTPNGPRPELRYSPGSSFQTALQEGGNERPAAAPPIPYARNPPQHFADPSSQGYPGGSKLQNERHERREPPPVPPPPPRHQQGLYLQSANNGGHSPQGQQIDPMNTYGGVSRFQTKEEPARNHVKEQKRESGSDWLFGELSPEEESEKRQNDAMVQETIQYNLRRKAEVELKQAEERHRAEERRREQERRLDEERREKERRLDEERRNAHFQQQMTQRDQELAALRNRFVEGQRNQEQQRYEQPKALEEESMKGQQPSGNAHHPPKHHEGRLRERFRSQEGSGDPPSHVVFGKAKGFFDQLIGSNSAPIRRNSTFFLTSCLVLSVLGEKAFFY